MTIMILTNKNKLALLIFFPISAHFNMCQKQRKAEVKGVKTLENFFANLTAKPTPARASFAETGLNDNDQEQFDGADAIVSEK